jgi:hypothetical protein
MVFDVMAEVSSNIPKLEAKGIVGYIVGCKLFSVLGPVMPFDIPPPTKGAGVLVHYLIEGNHTSEYVYSQLEPILQNLQQKWPMLAIGNVSASFPSFHSWYLANHDQSQAGSQFITGTRLQDAHALTSNLTASKLAFQAMGEDGVASAFVLSGRGVWNAKPRGGNAVCPAWRSAVAVTGTIKFYAIFHPGTCFL